MKADETPIFEIYHENSKLNSYDWEQFARIGAINSSSATGYFSSSAVIDIAQLTSVALPVAHLPSIEFVQVLMDRRSSDSGPQRPLAAADVAALLFYSSGLNGAITVDGVPKRPLRFCPSPGALYGVVTVLEVQNIKGLDAGSYVYDPYKHALGMLSWNRDSLQLAVQQPGGSQSCSCRIWLLARFERLAFKYGERAYRFFLLETGHIAQNILLVAEALKIPARPFGGFLDEQAKKGLGVEEFGLEPLYYVAAGM